MYMKYDTEFSFLKLFLNLKKCSLKKQNYSWLSIWSIFMRCAFVLREKKITHILEKMGSDKRWPVDTRTRCGGFCSINQGVRLTGLDPQSATRALLSIVSRERHACPGRITARIVRIPATAFLIGYNRPRSPKREGSLCDCRTSRQCVKLNNTYSTVLNWNML